MFKYIIWYDGGWLRDSSDLGYLYETEEEAREEAEADIDDYRLGWSIDNSKYDDSLFDIEITEV